MQTNCVEGQMTLYDVDTSFGKMWSEHCLQEKTKTENLKKEQTSKPSSRKSSKSCSQTLPMCLCLKGANGQNKGASMEWEKAESPFPWLTNCTMHSIGESHNADGESVYSLTSTDLQQAGFCLTLNLSEKPRVANPTLLSDILEEEADPKYNLSAKACRGILNRANKRGKKLPEVLEEALKAQISDEEAS